MNIINSCQLLLEEKGNTQNGVQDYENLLGAPCLLGSQELPAVLVTTTTAASHYVHLSSGLKTQNKTQLSIQ